SLAKLATKNFIDYVLLVQFSRFMLFISASPLGDSLIISRFDNYVNILSKNISIDYILTIQTLDTK
ncbi:hypothetical protein PI85_22660, partial [Lysinibacillus sp. A1]